MRSIVRPLVVLALLFIAVAPVEAQGGRPARQAVRERVIARRAVARARIKNMTPAQRQQLKASRQGMRGWRLANRPPLGLRGPRRPGRGEF